MTRTRTLIIIGCFMLALAIIAALELRTEPSQDSTGQVVTGALSKEPNAPLPGTASEASGNPVSRPEGGLRPLDNGTLRPLPPDENQRLTPLPPVETAESAPSQPSQASSAQNSLAQTSTPQPAEVRPGSGPDRPASPAPLVTQPLSPAETILPAAAADATTTAPRQDKDAPEQQATPAPQSQPGKPWVDAPESPARTATSDKPADKKPAESKADTRPSAGKSAEAKPRILTTNAPDQLAPGQKAIIWTHLELDGSGVIFRITGAQTLEGKGFELGAPDRYVVDLSGDWGISLPKVPNNALLGGIRAGRQGKDTRLVFDLKKKPSRCQIVRSNPETLEIRIR